jgi:hypothetical protein
VEAYEWDFQYVETVWLQGRVVSALELVSPCSPGHFHNRKQLLA